MKLIVAVSGGIDSVVLLDMLSTKSHECIVAHVDHGMREESADDAAFVARLAESYGCQYESTKLELGPGASEDVARTARYEWLEEVRKRHGADAIVTAHHQDDVIETIIINLIRGTGWRGVCSLRSTPTRLRPLLETSRQQIVGYAIEHELQWRDDTSNDDVRYLRNYIRHGIASRLSAEQRSRLIGLYNDQVRLAAEIDQEVENLLPQLRTHDGYSRYALIMMPRGAFDECLMGIVGQRLEKKICNQIRHFVCTGRINAQYSWNVFQFRVSKRYLIVSTPDI